MGANLFFSRHPITKNRIMQHSHQHALISHYQHSAGPSDIKNGILQLLESPGIVYAGPSCPTKSIISDPHIP